jgi:uncharacterized protein
LDLHQGLLLQEGHLQRLAELGLNEIRFDTAATGYNHLGVMANMALASRYLATVTVEIPAIPTDSELVLSSLKLWSEQGVRFLNIHELLYEPGTNSSQMPGAKVPFSTSDGHLCGFAPDSRHLTLEIMKRVMELNLELAVNDCSMQSKVRQFRGRRRLIAPLVKESFEVLEDDRFLVRGCVFNDSEIVYFPLNQLDEIRVSRPKDRFARITRRVPSSRGEPSSWVGFEEL